jgi:hypothetical protein
VSAAASLFAICRASSRAWQLDRQKSKEVRGTVVTIGLTAVCWEFGELSGCRLASSRWAGGVRSRVDAQVGTGQERRSPNGLRPNVFGFDIRDGVSRVTA